MRYCSATNNVKISSCARPGLKDAVPSALSPESKHSRLILPVRILQNTIPRNPASNTDTSQNINLGRKVMLFGMNLGREYIPEVKQLPVIGRPAATSPGFR